LTALVPDTAPFAVLRLVVLVPCLLFMLKRLRGMKDLASVAGPPTAAPQVVT
jgi:hypothetical protein